MNSAPLGGHNYTFFREKVCKKQLYTTCLPSNSRQTLRDKLVAIVNHLAEGPIFPLGSGRDKNKAKKDWILGWHSSEGHKDSVLSDRWSVAIQFRFYCFRTCWNWLVLIWNFTWFETWLWLEDGGVTNWHASSLHFIQCDILRIVFKVEKKKVNGLFSTLITQMETATTEQMELNLHSRSCYRVIGTSWSAGCRVNFFSWRISAPSRLCHSEFVCT